MLGGGVFVTQNKTLPGSYINFVNATKSTSTIGERGTVALIIADIDHANPLEVTQNNLDITMPSFFGTNYTKEQTLPIREILLHSNKVYVSGCKELGVSESLVGLESYDFNVLCVYTDDEEIVAECISTVKDWRDNYGKKCQVVVYNQEKPDHEGVINVVTSAYGSYPEYALVAWVAGAEAGCKINESCTNMRYDGEITDIYADVSKSDLEDCIKNGQIAFHNVYGEVRMLEDINSLTTTTADKGEDFKYNQTIRVIDQIANDIARLFNTKYLGKIPNNASGRVSLWADIVAHHRQLEEIQAIENFDSSLVTVEQGRTKKSVVVNDVITVVNAMSQLYMTVVVQ